MKNNDFKQYQDGKTNLKQSLLDQSFSKSTSKRNHEIREQHLSFTPKILKNQTSIQKYKPQQHSLSQEDQSSLSSSTSDHEAEKQKQKELKRQLMKENLIKRSNEKMIIGSSGMDITDFFQFQKKKEQISFKYRLSSNTQKNIIQQISGSRLAWIILLYSVTSGAMIPGWIMSIQANKLLRKSWRFFMQAFMVIPFVLYERRSKDENIKKKYCFSYIFKPQNLIKPYISSLAASLWFTVIISAFQWTTISHSLVLGSLSNFFLSLGRSFRKSNHEMQSGGQILVIAGILLVLNDTYSYDTQNLPPNYFTVLNIWPYKRLWYERMFFDVATLSMSYVMSQFSKYTSDLKNYYPPFLSMLIVNIFNCIHMTFSCFFVNGATFDFDSFFGIWSLFTNKHFTGFMYMAIVLSLGNLISIFMITKMFPDPIIPALAMTLQPFIASFIIDVVNVQRMPGSFSLIGYIFILPGLLLILVGQCLYQRIKDKAEEENKKSQLILQEMKELRQLQIIREERHKKRKEEEKKKKIIQKRSKLKKIASATQHLIRQFESK